MNPQLQQDKMASTTSDHPTVTEPSVHHPRFSLPLGVVLMIAFCGLAGPACYIGLAILQQ